MIMPTGSPKSTNLLLTSLLSESDMQRYVAWNATTQPYCRDVSVPQLVTAQAAMDPDRCALVTSNETVTYLELDRRSDQVSHYLRSLGVGSSTLVGICFERSIGMVVAALAILKAGCAYL